MNQALERYKSFLVTIRDDVESRLETVRGSSFDENYLSGSRDAYDLAIERFENHVQSQRTQEQEMLAALGYLKAVFPHDGVLLRFDIEYDHQSQFQIPIYNAGKRDTAGTIFTGAGTPMSAARALIKRLKITRVEEYIRLKEAQQ